MLYLKLARHLLKCFPLAAVAVSTAACVVAEPPPGAYYDGTACCATYYEYPEPYYRHHYYPGYLPLFRDEDRREGGQRFNEPRENRFRGGMER